MAVSDIPPPDTPGMYADAQGAWWYWDGSSWTPAPDWGPVASAPARRHDQDRSQSVLMWILFLVIGGWIAALIFYLIAKDEKPFTRHHAAEALNLTIVMLVPQAIGVALMIPDYVELITTSIDDPNADVTISGLFWAGVLLLGVSSLLHLVLGIVGAISAHRGQWRRLPIGFHPVRGVLGKGETPPFDVSGG